MAHFVQKIKFKARPAEEEPRKPIEMAFTSKMLTTNTLPRGTTGLLDLPRGVYLLKPVFMDIFKHLIACSCARCKTFCCMCEKKVLPKSVYWKKVPDVDDMCLAIELSKKNAEIWDEAFELEFRSDDRENKRCRYVSQASLKDLVEQHKNGPELISTFFTTKYATVSALLGTTNRSGGEAKFSGNVRGSAQWLRRLARKIQLANSGSSSKIIGDIAAMMREAFFTASSSKNKHFDNKEDSNESDDDDAALPSTFEVAVRKVARQGDRFVVGGRGILSNGSNVAITGLAEPVIGVGQGIALGLCRQVPFKPKMAELIRNGPLRYPGAHYVLREGDERPRIIPVDGFSTKEEALAWAGDAVIIARHIQDGDFVGVTRSPFVVAHNHLFMRVKVMPGFTIRPHDVILGPTDADFDGDGEILYVPNDLVAQEQWKLQCPSRLITYPSGVQAQSAMLDGRFGIESPLCEIISRETLLRVASVLPDIKVQDVHDLGQRSVFTRADVLNLCGSTSSTSGSINDEIRRLLVRDGPCSAMRLLFNSQNAGSALTASLSLPGFQLRNFLSAPGLDACQRGIAHALNAKKFHRKLVSMASARRDYHEVIVGFLEPIMALTYLDYDDEDLVILAELMQQIEREDPVAIQTLRSALIDKLKKVQSVNYMQEDLRLKIKSVNDAAQIAVGILRGSVSTEPRTMASVRWPHDQPSLLLNERMSCNVSQTGSQLLAIHATEGMAPKAQIEKTGDIRNNLAALFSDLRRDCVCALWSGDTQLFSQRTMPISLALAPCTLLKPDAECALQPTSCPWSAQVETPSGPEETLEECTSSSKVKKQLKQEMLDMEKDQVQQFAEAVYCTREYLFRELSGAVLPICCCSLISKGGDLDFDFVVPPVLCSQCGHPLVHDALSDSLTCGNAIVAHCPPVKPRILQFWTGPCCPEAKESISGPPHPRGVLRRAVFSGDVRLHIPERQSSTPCTTLYSERIKRAHERACRRCKCSVETSFLRIELDPSLLTSIGFSETEQFDLERRLSAIISPENPKDALACVLVWDAPSMISTDPVVLVHVYGTAVSSPNARRNLGSHRFGVKGATMYCSQSSPDFQMQFDKSTDANVDLVMRAIPVSAARLVGIVGDYQASLRYGGPERAERQMVWDQMGGKCDYQKSGPARLLAAKRTSEGTVMSVKARRLNRTCELMEKGTKRQAYAALQKAVLSSADTFAPAHWLGRPAAVGVSGVLLYEEPSPKRRDAHLAQNWNRRPIPAGLIPGEPVHSSRWLAFEERSRVLGIRALQIMLEGSACDDDSESPDAIAREELKSKLLPFAIAREYYGEDGSVLMELVWVAFLEELPDEHPEDAVTKRARICC